MRTAIATIVASGVQVVLATGRSPWNGVPELAATLGLPGLHITMQGAVISDPVTGRLERLRWLPREVYDRALRFAEGHALDPVVGTLEGHRAQRIPVGVDFLPKVALPGGTLRLVDDLSRLGDERPVRVFLPTRPERHGLVLARATRWFGDDAAVVWSDRSGIEILAAGTNKGEAVTWLAGTRGIDLADVAAVGDAANDTEMLQVVGRSAAMGVAPAHVRAAADIIVPSSDEDGLLDALDWYFPDLAVRNGCARPADLLSVG